MPKEIPSGYMYLLQAWISPNKVSRTFLSNSNCLWFYFQLYWILIIAGTTVVSVRGNLKLCGSSMKWLVIPSSLELQPLWCASALTKQSKVSNMKIQPENWTVSIGYIPSVLCSICQSSSGSVGKSIWLPFRRPKFKFWLDLDVLLFFLC